MKIRFLQNITLSLQVSNDSDQTVEVDFEEGWEVDAEVTPGDEASDLLFNDGSKAVSVNNSIWEQV